MIINELQLIHLTDQNYPTLLREIPNPPKKFYIKGVLPADNSLKIAIVGTRKATEEGCQLAKKIAYDLAQRGIIIVSGLAMGIDTAAHEGAIMANAKTIAVLANGLNSIYPKQNENLAKKILDLGGAIISEYEPTMPPLEYQFLERNRIISGLCAATIVIEAPERSGSLVTARLAGEQGREVFVVPGPVGHPNYRGSHQLIRDGARLITSAKDIIEDLNLKENIIIADENQETIFTAIQTARKPLAIDEIIEITKLDAKVANQALAFLAIEGIIKETKNGFTNS